MVQNYAHKSNEVVMLYNVSTNKVEWRATRGNVTIRIIIIIKKTCLEKLMF